VGRRLRPIRLKSKDLFISFLCLQDIKLICYRMDEDADLEPRNPSAASTVVTFLKFKSNGGE
jgi:hypothetical protein